MASSASRARPARRGAARGACHGLVSVMRRVRELAAVLQGLACRTSGLFSKHLTVVIWPLNLVLPPKSLRGGRGAVECAQQLA